MGYSRTILHNLGISRLVELEFSSVPDNNKLVENGWDVTSIYKWKDNKTNLTNILLKAERQVTFPELLSPTVIFNLDIYRSIITLTSKDWLFLIVTHNAFVVVLF